MIYLIGGVPGMRKSTVLSRCFLAQKSVSHFNSTDLIRASTSEVLRSVGIDPHNVAMKEMPELRTGEDTGAWIGASNLINLLNLRGEEALIEGLALPPTGVGNLERQIPNLKVRGAFVGYSKPMEFQPPEWTPELERLIEEAIGKDYLENFAKKYNWIYDEGGKGMHRYAEMEESEKIKSAAEKMDHGRFKYFDLVDYVPLERRSGDVATLRLEDHIKMAMKIRSFLLGQHETLGQSAN